MKLLRSKLTKRYMMITLIVILFALSSIYWVATNVLNSSIQEQIEERDSLIAVTLGKRINFMIDKIINDTRIVSNYLLRETIDDQPSFIDEIEPIVANDPLYLYLQAIDSEGNELFRVPGGISYDKSSSFEEINQRLSWTKTYFVSNLMILEDGTQTIAIVYPAVTEAGDYKGAIVAFLNLNTLSDYLSELKIGQQGINVVLDRQGDIIGHSQMQLIGFSIQSHILSDYLYKERFGSWQGEIMGQNMLVAYRPLSFGLGLLVAEPVEQAFAPSKEITLLLLKGFITILIITIILTLLGTSRVVRPILELINQAKEYKENLRSHFEPLQTKDELEDLFLTLDQMAEELKDKERRLFYILESIPYCVITTDNEGRITTFNKAAEKLTCFSREEAIGQFIIDLPLKEVKDEFITWKTLKEGKAFEEVETYIFDRHKQKHDIRMYSSLFQGSNQNIVGAIIIMRDVSEIKKLEEYLKQSERLASLGQLTAGIAHEIKNPLSIIQAATEAIDMEIKDLKETPKLIQELTEDILESSERMNALLRDFLKLSKGDEEDEKGVIDLLQIIEELIHLLRKKCNDQEISVERIYHWNEAYVYGSKNKMAQVFLNILLNGIQAMERGGKLSIIVTEVEQDWLVEIRDTGRGIHPAKIKWIFTPFFSTKKEGTGLGLSLSHEIVAQHNGKIWAESQQDAGTSLFVQIPKHAKGENDDAQHIASR